MQNIRKRNGDIVPFVRKKIEDAIHKANLESIDETFDGPILNMLTDDVVAAISSQEIPAVEFIQDTVEQVLIKHNYASTAKAFILYRAEHTKMRQAQGDLMDIYDELTFKKAADADIKRENANIDADTAMGTMLKYGSEGSKYYIDNYILPKDIAAAHADGDIHIHDKDFYMLTETCCQINLLKLFKGGFSTGHGFLREPNDIRSYAALACIAIQANQNEMHGGQAVPNFDYSMAPGVAKTFRKQYFEHLASFFRSVFGMKLTDAQLLANIDDIVATCCAIKARIVEQDEFDTGLRMLLNFGHTLGHAVEQHFGYSGFTHGEGVAIGMYQLTKRTEELGLTPTGSAERIKDVLQKYNLPIDAGVAKSELLDTMARDKKKNGNSITIIILRAIGEGDLLKLNWQQVPEYLG